MAKKKKSTKAKPGYIKGGTFSNRPGAEKRGHDRVAGRSTNEKRADKGKK